MSEKKYLTKNGAAALLGISRTKLERLLKEGAIAPTEQREKVEMLFSIADLVKYKERNDLEQKNAFQNRLTKTIK